MFERAGSSILQVKVLVPVAALLVALSTNSVDAPTCGNVLVVVSVVGAKVHMVGATQN